MKKILFIINDNISSNARSLYEIYSLAKSGHQIVIFCDKFQPKIKFLKQKNIKIVVKKSHNSLINKFLWYLFLIDYEWLNFLKQKQINKEYDIIHIQNNYLFKTVYKLINKKKIVLDIHDSLPESFISWNNDKNPFLRLFYILFANLKRLRNYERWSVEKSLLTLVTTQESKKKILSFYSNSYNKKTYVLENLETLFFQKKFKSKLKKSSNRRIIYFGGFAPHRGLETVIECSKLPIMQKIEFLLIGALNNNFSKKIEKSKSKNLKILKRIDLKKLKKFTNTNTIGIVPHLKNMHTNTTIPYKLSQYMSLGIPQIVSNCKPLTRTLKKSKSGLIFKSGDINDLKEKILKMNQTNLYKFRFNSLEYFKKHNWDKSEHFKIQNIYEKL